MTLGGDGLFYTESGSERKLFSMPAFKVNAVDSTGAGDIFHAAFSYGLLRGLALEKNLRLASAAAALSVTRPGGRTSIPLLEDSLKLADMDNTGGKTGD